MKYTPNQIVQGNALEVLKDIPDGIVDMVFTDPPYKVSQTYGGGVDADNLIGVASILRTFPEISRVLKQGRFFVSFYDNRILPFLFEAVKETDLVYLKSIYLYRRWGMANRWMGWMQCTDPICFFVKGKEKPFQANVKGKVKHDCYIKKGPEQEATGHPAQKPMDVCKDIIFWCTEENDLVVDPYTGSGTICKAARELNRKFLGVEIQKAIAEQASERVMVVKGTLESFL
jgi:site-specific DNA-methyltransferase (adenine-specific)